MHVREINSLKYAKDLVLEFGVASAPMLKIFCKNNQLCRLGMTSVEMLAILEEMEPEFPPRNVVSHQHANPEIAPFNAMAVLPPSNATVTISAAAVIGSIPIQFRHLLKTIGADNIEQVDKTLLDLEKARYLNDCVSVITDTPHFSKSDEAIMASGIRFASSEIDGIYLLALKYRLA